MSSTSGTIGVASTSAAVVPSTQAMAANTRMAAPTIRPDPMSRVALDSKAVRKLDVTQKYLDQLCANGAPQRSRAHTNLGTAEDMLAELLASGCSWSTIILARQIIDADKFAGDIVATTQKLNDLRDVHQKRISDLEAMKAFIDKRGSKKNELGVNDVKWGDEFFKNHEDLAEGAGFDLKTYNSLGSKADKQNYLTGCVRKLARKVNYRLEKGDIVTDDIGSLESGTRLSVEGLSAAIERHRGQTQSIDSQKQILNLRLQEMLQQKQRTSTLASNIIDAEHRSKDGIIKNTRA